MLVAGGRSDLASSPHRVSNHSRGGGLGFLARGLDNEKIAMHLGSSSTTVQPSLNDIF
jgi:hypothetical protein